MVSVSQGYLSKLEDGLPVAVSADIVLRLAEVLRVPIRFLQDEVPVPAFHPLYRKRASLGVGFLAQAEAKLQMKTLRVERLMRSIESDAPEIRALDPDDFRGGVKSVVRTVKEWLHIPSGPVDNLTELIEQGAGIPVIEFDFGTLKIDGVSIWFRGTTPLIFINPKLPADRIRLTLAHEFGHLIMHRLPKPEDEADEEANAFAAEFLMPEDEIRSSFYPLNLDTLARLKLRWKVSMATLLRRAYEIGRIKESYYRWLNIQMNKNGIRKAEPYEEMISRERPRLLNQMVAFYLEDLEYSREELCYHLNLTMEEFIEEFFPEERIFSVIK